MSRGISVAGAGLIGKRHVAAIAAAAGAHLHSIVDPTDTARDFAGKAGVPWFSCLDDMLASDRPSGIILATPNQLHVEQGLTCIQAGIPTLIEKPLATDVSGARALADAADRMDVPVLVGHHRRHNPLIAAAKAHVDAGTLGAIVAVHGMFWLYKPDDYFDVHWRTQPGAGPVLINLIHDVDLLRHLVGDVVSVQAIDSNAQRNHAVDETTGVLLRFANGAIGTINVSDTAVAPWSWELTSTENGEYPATGQSCYFIAGTDASLELPSLKIWSHPHVKSWKEPISSTLHPVEKSDPLVRQIEHFVRVITGEEPPLVSALEGMKTLEVIDAVKRAAVEGVTVHL